MKVSRLDLVDPDTFDPYLPLTDPQFHCCFQSKHPDGVSGATIIPIAASFNGIPAGLILASYFPVLHFAEIHSIFVVEDYRNMGVGTLLLVQLDFELRKLRCYSVTFVYPDTAESAYLSKLFHKEHWEEPTLFGIHCFFDTLAFNPPWLRRQYTLPATFSIFRWNELTEKEEMLLTSDLEQEKFPFSVSPFFKKDKIDPENSFGLRFQDRVVGWMIIHREKSDTFRYSALYLYPEFRMPGAAMKLLCKTIINQIDEKVPWSIVEVNVKQSSNHWVNFVKNRLVPLAESVTYTFQVWKKY